MLFDGDRQKLIFNVIARRFLMTHSQVPREWLPLEDNVTKIHNLVLTELPDIVETVGTSEDLVGRIIN